MSLEKDIFKTYYPDYGKLVQFGFTRIDNIYLLKKQLLNGTFFVEINISKDNQIMGTVYDKETGDEFLPLRVPTAQGAFVGKVRQEYINILREIRDNCFKKEYFVSSQGNRIANLIIKKYGDTPAFMWKKFPTYGVFKNRKNNKWYGIIMYIEKSKLDENSSDKVEIINVKVNKDSINQLLTINGVFPAWHMNKKHWISVVLDDTLTDKDIMTYIEESHSYTL